MNERFLELKRILGDARYFKIVCGAGNEDAEEVRKLSLVYTLAGVAGIDVSANVAVVKGAVAGVAKAYELAPRFGKKIAARPFINVSIGMRGDPHIRKAAIKPELCTSCGDCILYCPQKAIGDSFVIVEKRCIGCGECGRVCPSGAVVFFDKRGELAKILPECLKAGAETFELHAIIPDDVSVIADWNMMNDILPDNYISMCLDRSQLSDEHIKRRLKEAKKISGERFIVQADGVPMSGAADDYNTTLQAVAISDMVEKSGIEVMILASGGTNSKTGELLRLCGVKANGVSIGTFARRAVASQIDSGDFEKNMDSIKAAVAIAEKLVRDNLENL